MSRLDTRKQLINKSIKNTTNPKSTIVNIVLDESGSMEECREETIKGFNTYVEELKRQSGDIKLTLTKFNEKHVSVVYTALNIADVPKLTKKTYQPDSGTPLYDAIGKTVSSIEESIEELKDSPSVLFVIMTDGFENSSIEFTKDKITKLLNKKEKENWTFVYLGANQDAWAVGTALGIRGGNTMSYDTENTEQTYNTLARASVQYMSTGSIQTRSFFNDASNELKDKKTKSRSK